MKLVFTEIADYILGQYVPMRKGLHADLQEIRNNEEVKKNYK